MPVPELVEVPVPVEARVAVPVLQLAMVGGKQPLVMTEHENAICEPLPVEVAVVQ